MGWPWSFLVLYLISGWKLFSRLFDLTLTPLLHTFSEVVIFPATFYSLFAWISLTLISLKDLIYYLLRCITKPLTNYKPASDHRPTDRSSTNRRTTNPRTISDQTHWPPTTDLQHTHWFSTNPPTTNLLANDPSTTDQIKQTKCFKTVFILIFVTITFCVCY